MTQYYELSTLTMQVGNLRGERFAAVVDRIGRWAGNEETGGTLLGMWLSEISPQNRVLVLRGFDSREALSAERERVLLSSDPFGTAETLHSIKMESFAQFPTLPPIKPATLGPVYEFRTYELKIGGLQPTLMAWAKAIPGRTALSPLMTAMYALDGTPRFIHIWAYRSFEERLSIRETAFGTGVWPAPGAPSWLMTEMKSEVYMPTALSPLQ